MPDIYPKAFFGGRLVDIESAKLDIASSAVLYGLSVYTVFTICALKDGKLAAFRLKDHYIRLADSAKIIGMDGLGSEWTFEKFQDTVKKLVDTNKVKEDVFVRASLHVNERLPGVRSRGLSTILSMFVYEAEPILPQDGARLKTSVWRRVPDYSIPSRAKVNGAYVNSVLARQDALDSGYDDCIFLDANGHVCELSAANIFLVRNGELITPHMDSDILEGINRKTIISIAQAQGIPVKERSVDLTEVYIADEVLACGTSAYVSPIVEIDARKIANGQTGPMTRKLRLLHDAALHGADSKHSNWLTYI